MNLKLNKIIATVAIFLLCFIIHFAYNLFPNPVSAIFFPVNESIWEHMKMLYTSIIIYGLIDYLIMQKFHIKFSNFFMSLFISGVSSIPIFLILYLSFYYKIGPKMFLNILILFIAIAISQIISFYILKRNDIKNSNIISILLIIITFVIFGYLTYKPIKNELFFDGLKEKYGLNIYRLNAQVPNQ